MSPSQRHQARNRRWLPQVLQPAENGHVGGIGVARDQARAQVEEKAPDALTMDAVVSAALLGIGELALQRAHDRVAAGSLGHQFADQRVEVIPAHHVIPLNYAASRGNYPHQAPQSN